MPAKKTTNRNGANGANGGANAVNETAELVVTEAISAEETNRKVLLKSKHDDQLRDELDERELLKVLLEVRNGNFSVRMPIDRVGMSGKICDTLNDIISTNERMIREFTKAGNIIGKQGKLTQRIE